MTEPSTSECRRVSMCEVNEYHRHTEKLILCKVTLVDGEMKTDIGGFLPHDLVCLYVRNVTRNKGKLGRETDLFLDLNRAL